MLNEQLNKTKEEWLKDIKSSITSNCNLLTIEKYKLFKLLVMMAVEDSDQEQYEDIMRIAEAAINGHNGICFPKDEITALVYAAGLFYDDIDDPIISNITKLGETFIFLLT